MGIKRLLRRRRERSLGQSLVEFAIVLPVFLVIVSAAVDLGRMAYGRITIANVAREASFQAAQTPTSYLAGQACNTTTNLVICRGILESKGSVITVNPADITLTCSPSCTGAMGNTVTVKATGTFNLLTPVMAAFFGGTTVTFSSSATNQINALPPSPTTAPTPTPSPTPSPSPSPTPSPTPLPTISCSGVSAGFTNTNSPSSNQSPVSVTVTDTSTYNALCSTVWAWNWGDGVTTYGRTQPAHTYTNSTGQPGNTKTFNLTLTVTSGAFTSTSGAVAISVIR